MEPIVSLAANVRGKLSDYTLDLLHEHMRAVGATWVFVTSLERNSREQADAMFTNCRNTSPAIQRKLYGPFGDQIVAVYEAGVALNLSDGEVIARMTKRINDLGPHNVSHHCADSKVMQVVDISPRRFTPESALPAFIERLKNDHRISALKTPADGDPAVHAEVPQPQAKLA
jgi:hypothetical protein